MGGVDAGEVDRVSYLLFETWKKADPNSGVAKHPVSYIANFADMARAVIADRAATEARLASEMPTIWEDPAGKGYPCFERPMTPAEAKETIDRLSERVVALEARLAPSGEVERLKLIARALRTRMATACDWTKAGKDHVKVRTADWHVLMEIGERAKEALASLAPPAGEGE